MSMVAGLHLYKGATKLNNDSLAGVEKTPKPTRLKFRVAIEKRAFCPVDKDRLHRLISEKVSSPTPSVSGGARPMPTLALGQHG